MSGTGAGKRFRGRIRSPTSLLRCIDNNNYKAGTYMVTDRYCGYNGTGTREKD